MKRQKSQTKEEIIKRFKEKIKEEKTTLRLFYDNYLSQDIGSYTRFIYLINSRAALPTNSLKTIYAFNNNKPLPEADGGYFEIISF